MTLFKYPHTNSTVVAVPDNQASVFLANAKIEARGAVHSHGRARA